MSQTESRTPPQDDVTVLSRNTEITGGKLKVAHDLTVRGVVEGEVQVGGKVVVAAGARVVGKLHAREAIIAGTVRGEVEVTETLTVRSTAVVDGSARATRLIVEEGSSGDVNLRIGSQESFDLLQRRRRDARAELDRVRSRSVTNGHGADEGSPGWSKDVAVLSSGSTSDRAKSSDELLASKEMREFLPGESGSDDVHVAPTRDQVTGDQDRASK